MMTALKPETVNPFLKEFWGTLKEVNELKRGEMDDESAIFVQRMFDKIIKAASEFENLKRFDRKTIERCIYALVALVDEVILNSNYPWRSEWILHTLQLKYFNEQVAGERFYEFLEELKNEGEVSIYELEIYFICLLLGFKGRYINGCQQEYLKIINSLREPIQKFYSSHMPSYNDCSSIKTAYQHTESKQWKFKSIVFLNVFFIFIYAAFAVVLQSSISRQASAARVIVCITKNDATNIQ